MKPTSTIENDGIWGFLLERLFCWFLIPAMVLFFIALFPGIGYLAYLSYQESKSPVFELKKSEWTCDKTYIYYTDARGIRYAHEACARYVKDVDNETKR